MKNLQDSWKILVNFNHNKSDLKNGKFSMLDDCLVDLLDFDAIIDDKTCFK